MSDTKFPVEDKYNKILEEQEALDEKLKHSKNNVKSFLEDTLSRKDDIKFKVYERAVDNIERLRNSINEKQKYIDDTTIKLVDNANKNKETLKEVTNILDDFMKKFNETKIGNLEKLLRYQLKTLPKDKLKSLSQTKKTVLEETYGGKKRRTMKKNFSNKKTVKNRRLKCPKV
jgi:hypothetical protein